MVTLTRKRLGCLVLGCLCSPAWGQIIADKTILNSESGITTISVRFATPVQGDLYLATPFNGQLFFFADNGKKFTPEVSAFIKNGDFSAERPVLQLSSKDIPPAEYSIYQVVTYAGKTPLDFNNWIGGVNGLSELKLQINLPIVSVFSPIPEPVPVATAPVTAAPVPIATSTPSNICPVSKVKVADEQYEKIEKESEVDECKTPVSTVTPDGKSLYQQYCATCHGSKPEVNTNKVLRGKEVESIREAIKKNKGGMGFLVSLNDADLKAIAAYLKTF